MKYISVVFLVLCFSCSSADKQEVLEIRLSSNNPESLIQWYTSNLSFVRSAVPSELKVKGQGFEINFQETSTPAPSGRTTGFFKYGFTTNRIDDLYSAMKKNGVQFRGDIFTDNNLNQRSFVSLDSDGNRVQFFEDNTKPDLTPYFFSVITNDFDNALNWYQTEMGFNEGFNLDLPERNFQIRLMKNDQWLLELLSLPQTPPLEENQPGISSFAGVPLK